MKRYMALADIVTKMLGIQKVITPKLALVNGSVINKGAIGYVYGLIDGAAQSMNLEIHNEWGDTLLTCSFNILQAGSGQFLRTMLPHLERDDAYMDGVFQGGNEFNNWAKTKAVPLGLTELGAEGNSVQIA